MIDSDRKLLTEWLGEKWHEIVSNIKPSDLHVSCTCSEGELVLAYLGHKNRDFTTPDDFFALKNRLVEVGKFQKFKAHAWERWDTREAAEFEDWLIDTERFPELVVRYLKEKK